MSRHLRTPACEICGRDINTRWDPHCIFAGKEYHTACMVAARRFVELEAIANAHLSSRMAAPAPAPVPSPAGQQSKPVLGSLIDTIA